MYSFIMLRLIGQPVRRYENLKGDLSPLYSMNKFVTNKSKLPQDGARVFPYMG